MRRNTDDATIEKSYLQRWKFLMTEYELVKAKKHPRFKFVTDFYKAHGTTRQTFAKYRNRYLCDKNNDANLLPRKRGPKWHARRTPAFIEQKVLKLRSQGINRYEIYAMLKPNLKKHTPSATTIYRISQRNGLGRLTPKMKQNKRKIIKERAGQLGHIDCHYLPKDLIPGIKSRAYLVAILDDASRVCWAELIFSLKTLDVMFASLKIINLLNAEYGIKFEEMLSDNGSEFSSRNGDKNLHAFERMLIELEIKHRYTKPYRPQTNGKVERFWRTLNDDMIDGTTFDNLEHFKTELQEYLLYYNIARPHQGINGITPVEQLKILSTN